MTQRYGIKGSQEGFNVLVADDKDLSFSSQLGAPKMEESNVGVFEYTFSSNPGTGAYTLLTVPHGYDYTPVGYAYVFDDTNTRFSALPYNISNNQYVWCSVDDTNLYIKYNVDSAPLVNVNGYDYTFKYYIWAETGAV